MKTLKEFGESGKLIVAAHRGSSGNAPENTISAFRLALEEGANMVETDLQFTSDGYLVAVHDLYRYVTNNTNKIQTLEDFKKLDAGEWFDPKFKGEKIPQLEEILDFAKDNVYLNLELKVNKKPIENKQIEYMLNVIYQAGFEKHLMFSSFNHSLLKLIKTIDSGINTAVINIPGKAVLPSVSCQGANADAYICSMSELDETINNDIIENNIFLGVYSVDNEEQFDFVSKFKISAIGTNYPKVINNILKERN